MKKTPKVEEAIKVLQEKEQKEIEAFLEDYKKVCDKHKRRLVPDTRFNVIKYE